MAAGVGKALGTELGRTVTGNVETALLIVHDFRDHIKSMGSGLTKDIVSQEIRNSLVAGTMAALGTGAPPSYPGSKDKTFKVQFNPSELTLNANSTPVNKIDSSTGQARTIAAEDPKLSLRVKLYFDDMNTADSFMAEKFSSGATAQTIGNIAEGVKSAMGKKHTVQPQVEALVAALRNPYTRTVSFRWADFSFIGHLHAVHARYTMFSVSGRPVRAEVELMIQHEMDNILLRQWYEDFNKAFGGVAGTMTKAQQKVGNILNLNL